jgi:hypothetical protein
MWIKDIAHYLKNIKLIEQFKIEGQTRETCQARCLCFFFVLERKRELGHALFTSLVIVGVDKTHTICLSLQAQRGFFLRGGSRLPVREKPTK